MNRGQQSDLTSTYCLTGVRLYKFPWFLAPMTEIGGDGNVTWIIIRTWQFSHKHNNTTLRHLNETPRS